MDVDWAREVDFEPMREIYAPVIEQTAISFETEVPTAEEWANRVDGVRSAYPWLVMRDGGRVLGYAYGTRHRARAAYGWSTEVSAYVGAAHRGQGVGRKLYEPLLKLLALQGFRNAYAGITLPNDASVRLHEAVGFQPLGVFSRVGFKFDTWHDVGWWQRPLDDGSREAPRKPWSIESLQVSPEAKIILKGAS